MAGQVTQTMVAIAPGRFGSPQAYGFAANGAFERAAALYIVCSNPGFGQFSWVNDNVDGDPPPVLALGRVLKSTDDGATWAEVDIDNGPQVSIKKSNIVFRGLTSPMAACYLDSDTLLVGYYVWDYTYGDAPEMRFSTFDMSTDTWGAEVAGGPAATILADQPQLNLSMALRSGDGAIVFEYDAYENVGGSNRCRVFCVTYLGAWGAAQPLDAGQAGSTDDYCIAGAVAGDGGRTHLAYQTNVGGSSNLLQVTLDATDTLLTPVAITSDVDIDASTPPFGAPWGFLASRTAAGVTTLFLPYVKTGTKELNFQSATSADSPAFAETTIGGVNCDNAGISNCGPIAASQGLAGVTQENFNDVGVSGSQDVTTWEPFTPLTIPVDPSTGPSIGQYLGLGITQGNGGLFAAGVVANAFYFPPG